MRAKALATLLLLCFLASAQQQPPPPQEQAAPQAAEEPERRPLVNTGAPMRLAYECTEEDIRASGLVCTVEDPCPVFFELVSAEPLGAKLFATGNVHTSSTTLYSVLLASEDGGKTWTEPYERLRFTLLDQIQFHDFEIGWVAGQVVHPLPRDPFLLLTTDGGKSWKQRQVYDDGRIGSVERFTFESRTSGSLWVDRSQSGEPEAQHERYETMTGGESWMLREVSGRALEAKRARPYSTNSDWRALVDEQADCFRIEKRQGDKWQGVASFLIPIAACRPPEKPVPVPESESTTAPELPAVKPAPSPKPRAGPPSQRPKPK